MREADVTVGHTVTQHLRLKQICRANQIEKARSSSSCTLLASSVQDDRHYQVSMDHASPMDGFYYTANSAVTHEL